MKTKKIIGVLAAVCIGMVMRSGTAAQLYEVRGGITVYQGEACAVLSDSATGFNEVGQLRYGIPVLSGELTVPVTVLKAENVVPGGQCIGIALYTDGLIVVGYQEINCEGGKKISPGGRAGLISGDIIQKINGQSVSNMTEFALLADKEPSATLELLVLRNGSQLNMSIQPEYDINDKKYRFGLWLKDSTAGIGTLTYYNPENMRFAALGHAICESETGVLMPLKNGEIVKCTINEIQKGEKGRPGELKGSFRADAPGYGIIQTNSEYGLYGVLQTDMENGIYSMLPVGSRNSVKTGKATILTSIDNVVKEYEVNIVKVNRQETRSAKGMVIEVTDKTLLEKTGGIVQGMSGSPIIQDGRVIGAVTHVLINDPTRGYGLFIDWMDTD